MIDHGTQLLELVKDWKDPSTVPWIEYHKPFYVVRDDVLEGGSKQRWFDCFIRNLPHKEIVFGGASANGYSQVALPIICKRYKKKAILFVANRNPENMHVLQKKAILRGAKMIWVKNGMLAVTLARAREYCEADPNERFNIKFGLEDPTVMASIVKVARDAVGRAGIAPPEIWTVGSNGTLNRGLQLAFPYTPVNVVQVGHKMTYDEIGRATLYKSKYTFTKECPISERPPFPSAPTYDAKAWIFMKKYAKKNALFWNVGA